MIEIIIGTFLLLAAAYLLLVRPWILRMGTLGEEAYALMPGDGLVPKPNMKYTQAITIHAPGSLVWSYLIQIGYRRAGWYNWDFINRLADRDYFYEGRRSAERVIEELQQLQAGDKIHLTPQLGMEVESIVTGQYLTLTGGSAECYQVAWTFCIKELDQAATRLIVRWRSNQGEGPGLKLLNLLLIEPGGAGIQQSKMLKGIKNRAERDYRSR